MSETRQLKHKTLATDGRAEKCAENPRYFGTCVGCLVLQGRLHRLDIVPLRFGASTVVHVLNLAYPLNSSRSTKPSRGASRWQVPHLSTPFVRLLGNPRSCG